MVDMVKLGELAKAATPGPWQFEKRTATALLYAGLGNHRANVFNNDELGADFEDAKFIAAANPATVLDLLAEIERLNGLLNEAGRIFEKDLDSASRAAQKEIDGAFDERNFARQDLEAAKAEIERLRDALDKERRISNDALLEWEKQNKLLKLRGIEGN